MRKTIKSLQFKAEYYSKKVERLSTNEVQNEEIGKLVDLIANSEDGRHQLTQICREANGIRIRTGLGDVVKRVWEDDCDDWNQFKHDQETNSKCICHYIIIITVRFFLTIASGSKGNRWSSVTIRLG